MSRTSLEKIQLIIIGLSHSTETFVGCVRILTGGIADIFADILCYVDGVSSKQVRMIADIGSINLQ